MNGRVESVRTNSGQCEVRQFQNPEQLAASAAQYWVSKLQARLDSSSGAAVALSGGRIAASFFDAIVRISKDRSQAHARVHFFWADERCVPPESSESNYPAAFEHLLRPLGVQEAQIHRIRGELRPEEAALRAENELLHAEVIRPEQPTLDLVFLGMGEDGHVASLFPGEAPEASDSSRIYRPVVGPKPPPNRVTISYEMLARATEVLVLASGKGKTAALKQSLQGATTPLGRVLNSRRTTLIFTDIGY